MKLILFGSGASYFDKGIIPKKPPLGTELFDCLQSESSLMSALLLDKEISAFKINSDFEKGMINLLIKHSTKAWKIMREMGKFFPKFRLNGKNDDIYSQFLLKLKKNSKLNDIIFVSLNYECLLEQAMKNILKWEIDDIYGSINQKFIISDVFKSGKLIKPHGSCNFWLPEAQSDTGIINIDKYGLTIRNIEGSKVDISTIPKFNWEIYEIVPLDKIIDLMKISLKHPIMSFYAPKKIGQFGGNLIILLKSKLSEKIQNAESISVIGVSPNFDDLHIWKYIIETNAPVYYLEPNEKNFYDLAEKRTGKETIHIHNTFENGYEELIEMS